MTDTSMPLAITPEQAQAMPETTRNAARAAYAQHYPAAELERVFGAAAQPAPHVQHSTETHIPGTDVRVAASPSDGLTYEQRLAGFKNVLKVTADPEAVITAAEASGISRAELEVAPADPAAVVAAQREAATADALSPPANAADYALTYDRDFAENLDTAALAALDTQTRQAFHAAGVPNAMAQGLLETLLDTAAIYHPEMSDAAKQLRWKEEGAMFKKLSADPADNARLANLAYSKLPAAYRANLDKSYSLHSARAQLMLAGIGRALEYQGARKARK